MTDVSSCFLLNSLGEVAIAFDDAAFVCAERVIVDRQGGRVHAQLHERIHHVGDVSIEMVDAFARNHDVLLTGVRADGSVLDLRATVVVIN